MALMLTFAILLPRQVAADLASGLVGHWTLNEGAGTLAADVSGHGNHGLLASGPVWTTGRFGGGLRFDGIDDFVDVPDSASLNPASQLTLAAWFNSDNVASGAMLISKGASGAQYNLREFASSLRFRVKTGGVINDLEVPCAFSDGIWYHVAGVYNGSTMQVFVNGAPVGNVLARTGPISPDTVGVTLGKRSGSTLNYFSGILDDVRIYNRALSTDEIAALAGLTNPQIAPGLVGHWRLNEEEGSLAADASGHNNHGLLTDGPVWTTGRFGGGLYFDGVDDFVDVPDSASLNPASQLTLAAWFNSDNVASGAMLISKGANGTQYNLREFASSLRFRVKTGGVINDLEVPYAFTDGIWHHVAGVYNGSTMQVFVNGAPVGNVLARTGPISPDTVGVALGKRSGNTLNYFSGILDDVRIYNRALSTGEIAALAGLTDDRPLPETVTVNSSVTNQVIRSWGAPYGGLLYAPDLMLNAILDEFVDSMGLNRTRLEPRNRDWEDPFNDNGNPFDAAPAAFRLGDNERLAKRFVVPFKQRVEAAGDRFECYASPSFFDDGASGSVPAWMLNHPGEYAEWAIQYLEFFRTRHNIVPDFYVICNEAGNGNPFSPAVVAGMIKTLAPRMEALGFKTRIQFPESVNADASWSAIQATQNDAEMWRWVGLVSYHLYGGGSRTNIRDFARARGLLVGQTEYIGLTLDLLYQDLIEGGVSTWEFYAASDFIPQNPQGAWFNRNANFWQIRQVTRFVRPGAIRVGATASSSTLRVLAFQQNGASVLVLLNLNGPARSVDVAGIAQGQYARSQTVGGAPATELGLVTVPPTGTTTVNLPANSVFTLYPDASGNLPPCVTDYKATPSYLTLPAASATLSASATDPELTTLAFTWSVEQAPAGVAVQLNTPQSPNCAVSGLSMAGDYAFKLVVSDGANQVTRRLPLTVYMGNQAPVFFAPALHHRRPVTVMLPQTSATLIHFASDLENDPIAYQWTVASQPPGANATLATPTQSACIANNLTVAGDYVFRVTAQDSTHSVSTNHTLTVYPINTAPVIANVSASPSVITLPFSESILSGETSDPEGDILSHWWSVRSAPAGAWPVFANQGAKTTMVRGLIKPGAYVFRLTVVDRASFRTSDITVTVQPGTSGPLLFLISPGGGETYMAGQNVFLRWSSYNVSTNVQLEFFDGTAWQTISASTPDDGIEAWTLPAGNFSGCRIRVSDAADASVLSESGAPFTITRDTPRILGAQAAAGQFSVTITQRPGAQNTLQRAPSLNHSAWQDLVTLTNFSQTITWFDRTPPLPAGFYRVLSTP
jgi:hypothetical protein